MREAVVSRWPSPVGVTEGGMNPARRYPKARWKMLIKLKATLAHNPLAGFFALVGVACVVYVGLLAVASPMVANEWTNRFPMVSAMVAGLVALVCCW